MHSLGFSVYYTRRIYVYIYTHIYVRVCIYIHIVIKTKCNYQIKNLSLSEVTSKFIGSIHPSLLFNNLLWRQRWLYCEENAYQKTKTETKTNTQGSELEGALGFR